MKSTITVQTDETRHRRIKAYAAATGLSIRALLESAIDRILEEIPVLDEKTIAAEFNNSPEIRAEFGTLTVYRAYRAAIAAGQTREMKPRKEGNHGQA